MISNPFYFRNRTCARLPDAPRKHVKTVHGAESYASNKHKRMDQDQDGEKRLGYGSCHLMTPNSNGSGSPKIKTEVCKMYKQNIIKAVLKLFYDCT